MAWHERVAGHGELLGLTGSGRGAPYGRVYNELETTVQRVIETAKRLVGCAGK